MLKTYAYPKFPYHQSAAQRFVDAFGAGCCARRFAQSHTQFLFYLMVPSWFFLMPIIKTTNAF